MSQSEKTQESPDGGKRDEHGAISIVQRGNLKALEQTLRKQWRLGQNMVLWDGRKRGRVEARQHRVEVFKAVTAANLTAAAGVDEERPAIAHIGVESRDRGF